jgi:DNA-binding response OmpR family regulator
MELSDKEVTGAPFAAACILVVEDSIFILMELEAALHDAGVPAVCACRTVHEALSTLEKQPISAAILDVQLDRETSGPVAQRLAERGVPFFFYTGAVEDGPVRREWPECKVVTKPAARHTIVQTVAELLAH